MADATPVYGLDYPETGDQLADAPATIQALAESAETALLGKAASVHTHDWADITGEPSTFPPSAHTHAIADVTGLQPALDGKAATVHTHAIADVTGLQPALDTKEATTNKGAANGYAPLDSSSLVPAVYLPSFVDDVIEAANFAALPGTGATGKIYVTLDTGKIYRWSGSAYVEISPSPGSTDAVPEGATNKYFTDARAIAAVVVDSIADADTTHSPSRNAVFDALALKLDKAGGTVTGNLTVARDAALTALAVESDAGQFCQLNLRTDTTDRWIIRKTSTAEAGSNSGSNLEVAARDDAGSPLSVPIAITRSTGTVTFGGALVVNNSVTLNRDGTSCSMIVQSDVGQNAILSLRTESLSRWNFVKDVDPESGSDAGSSLQIQSFTDAGGFKANVVTLTRSTGQVRFGAYPIREFTAATGSRPTASAAGSGAHMFDTTLGKPIWSNGTNWVDATGATV